MILIDRVRSLEGVGGFRVYQDKDNVLWIVHREYEHLKSSWCRDLKQEYKNNNLYYTFVYGSPAIYLSDLSWKPNKKEREIYGIY